MNPERTFAYRKQAGTLLDAVLSEDITPRTALNCWPTHANTDPSILCAYTMLWYFEADEDRHKIEPFYADVQLQLLKETYEALKQGKPLAPGVVMEYQERIAPTEYKDVHTWQHPLQRLQRWLNQILAILDSHPTLSRLKARHGKKAAAWYTTAFLHKRRF